MRYETSIGVNLPYQLAPLTLTVDNDDHNLQCRWLYRRSMVEKEHVELLSRCYQALLQYLVKDNDQHSVRSASMVDKAEYDRQVSQNTLSPLSKPNEPDISPCGCVTSVRWITSRFSRHLLRTFFSVFGHHSWYRPCWLFLRTTQ